MVGRYATMDSSRSSSNQMHALPLLFYQKSMCFTNFLIPLLYIALNLFVSVSLCAIVLEIQNDTYLYSLGAAMIPLTLLSIVFYLLSACTNPGLLLGNEEVQLQKAKEWDLKHQTSN